MYMVNCTSDEFRTSIEHQNVRIAIIPVGSVEAHGHHLPLGTDIFSPVLFTQMLEQKQNGRFLILPAIPFGQSRDLKAYPGTIHIPSDIMAEYVYHVGKSLIESGIHKIVFLNGHGGNITALNLAGEKLVELSAHVLTINWWMDYSKEILSITEGQGHGGEDETSAILYYNESLVKMELAMKNTRTPVIRVQYPERGTQLYRDALSGDATLATHHKGKRIFELLTDKILETLELFDSGNYFKG